MSDDALKTCGTEETAFTERDLEVREEVEIECTRINNALCRRGGVDGEIFVSS